MKKLLSLLCTAIMVMSFASSVMAAGSIVSVQPQEPTVSGATIPDGAKVVLTAADPTRYTSEVAQKGVEYVNNSTGPVTMEGFFEACGIDMNQTFKTTTGDDVVPADYDFVSDFSDLALDQGTEITVNYNLDGTMEVTFKAEISKDSKAEDLMIAQINDESGEILWIPVKEYNAETGEITADFPCLGPIAICEKTDVQ